MSLFSLILSNLRYYRKAYLAILAGTVISTAVLTGALVVGDSVKYSLGQLTEIRLGKTRYALSSGDRYFSQQLAHGLSDLIKGEVAPTLNLEGIAINNDQNSRINRVEVMGIDSVFMKLWKTTLTLPSEDEAIISRNTAEKLKLKPGDEFLLKIHKQAKASENAPFISEKEPLVSFRLKVAAVADDHQMGRFSLKSNQSAPYTIFIPLESMALKVELPGNANLMLVNEKDGELLSVQLLDSLLHLKWQPQDAGLTINALSPKDLFEIRSDRIFIDDNTAKAIQIAVPEAEPVFTYLVNSISSKNESTPYSFVTASDLMEWNLSEHEILINSWLADDLSLKPGDSVSVRYFKMGALRKLTEDSALFIVKAVVPISNPVFDRTLMPDFPGMSDAGNCRDWETGAPVDLDKIRDKDEQYWNEYQGTPKAFISLASGIKLWDNAFGQTTAFRFIADSCDLQAVKTHLMTQLIPIENGLQFEDVYAKGKASAANSTDFGVLFLSLSFFIIISALLLTALLFSLHAQKRMAETALLATLGFRKKDIIRIMFIESALVVIAGSTIGSLLGILYNNLMLWGLNTLWQDAVRTSMLQLHFEWSTLITGFTAGTLTALLPLLFILVRNLRKPLSETVKGTKIQSLKVKISKKKLSLFIAIICFSLAIALVIYSFAGKQAGTSELSLSAGGLILAGGIALLFAMLHHAGLKTVNAFPGFLTVVLRNASTKKRRTVAAVTLLAIGTFSVVITGANRKTFFGTENMHQSGTGGFLLWAESTIPVLNDLNSPEGKKKYGLADEKEFQNVHFAQMLSLDGDDASCLNLNQVSQPKILGINPMLFDQQQSFSFAQLDETIIDQHPWLALNEPLAPGIIPAFADQTVITWGLQKKIGDTLLYTDESGKILKIRIIGGLASSVFQGHLLISAELFRQYFPSVGGSKIMLVDGEFGSQSVISDQLEYLFQDFGMVVTPTSEKLAQFYSVENTYLTVFMMLGGLGIIIGTIGLGIVLLRNLEDRKQEIAIYQAIGFHPILIHKLIFAENLFILLTGMGIGLIAAFTGILPSFFSPAFQFPTAFVLVLIFLVLLNGLAWIYFPLRYALRKNLVVALRKE
jgi:ABC-type antimicrobial peptide transport system permease subunit